MVQEATSAMKGPVTDLAAKVQKGDRRSISRAITLVESESPEAPALLATLFPQTGRAYRIGMTGPPGAGKSTLTNRLAAHYRSEGKKVGIIAVDPTSPFTGGALLGDRIRMSEVEMDPGVFIRSMASRGSLGGLSRRSQEAGDVLDAGGFDVVLFETVGVGQSELDIAGAADCTVVILVPESGDGIQAMKAGLMEIADFFVLNKSDRPGADQAVMSIKMTLGFRPHDEHSWVPNVVKTQASQSKGIVEVAAEVERHRLWLMQTGALERRRRSRIRDRVRMMVEETLHVVFWDDHRTQLLDRRVGELQNGSSTPYAIVAELVADFSKHT